MSRFLPSRRRASHGASAHEALELEQKASLLPSHAGHARASSAGGGGSAGVQAAARSPLRFALGRACALRRRTLLLAMAGVAVLLWLAAAARSQAGPPWRDAAAGFGFWPGRDEWLGPSTSRRWSPPSSPLLSAASSPCTLDVSQYRARYNLSADAAWARQFVRRQSSGTYRGAISRGSAETPESTLVSLDVPLLPNPAPLVPAAAEHLIGACSGLEGALSLPMQTQVERPGPMHILFGAATTRARVLEAIPDWLWLVNAPGARLLILVEEADERNSSTIALASLNAALSDAGINGIVEASPLDFERRYMSLVAAFRRHRRREEWFATIDDDTAFIRGLEPIWNMLRKYDARKNWLVGTFSEAQAHYGPIGRIAFGGGGIFLSKGLVENMTKPRPDGSSPHSDCDAEHNWGGGDLRISHCAYDKLRVEVSVETALHQMDLLGSSHGVLESGQEVSSFHHYKSWNHFDPTRMMRAGAICHGICVLQRFDAPSHYWTGQDVAQLATHNISISTPRTVLAYGVSLTHYPTLPDLAALEKTWNDAWDHGVFRPTFNFGPLRAPQGEGSGRFTWNLEGQHVSRQPESGSKWLHQLYVRRVEGQQDSVVEYVWLEK